MLNAYGWPHHLADDQILERLLELNLQRTAARGVADETVKTEDAINESDNI